jgi:integrase
MIKIDWNRDYKGEFVCPHCYRYNLQLSGWTSNKHAKRLFKCTSCYKYTSESHNISLSDFGAKINWRRDYKLGEFACPNPECNARCMWLLGFAGGKRQFKCKFCASMTIESIEIVPTIMSRLAHHKLPVKPFCFDDDKWDLRALIPLFNCQDNKIYVNFEKVQQDWFKLLVKRYIYFQCKTGASPATVYKDLCQLRIFSRYLAEQNIVGIYEINRGVILSFLIWDRTGDAAIRDRLGALRQFFWTGTIQEWFEIDQDIIRDDDYPKEKRGNPDPISDTVRKQIENNLHKLPDPIARMWLITFFAAMRPSELALLRKDCLVQEGSGWKIVWQRKKTKDEHEVPITRIIAKVIQEQLEYIEQLWGDNWEYLFCHYQGLSKSDFFQANLKPVKKVIPQAHSPLQIAICCLIEAENIRDDNGKLAKFSPCLVRPTRLTQLFEQGHDLAVVSAWAGHKQLATTALHYTRVSCDLIEKEVGHIQRALFNADGQYLRYESLPKSFWETPRAHELELSGDHINTPIYGYCGLPLDQDCEKFRACYTCRCFVATPEKLPLYTKTRDELRAKESRAKANGQDVLVEQYGRQADQLDKIIASLKEVA